MSSKVPAFTVLEAVVSMAVTAIILSVVFVIYSITSQRLADFKNQNQIISDLNRMTYTINKSIFESETMHIENDVVEFTKYSGGIIRYELNEEYFTRTENDFTDTFHLETRDISTEIKHNRKKGVAYQLLLWNIYADKNIIRLKFYKKLYPDQLLQSELNEH